MSVEKVLKNQLRAVIEWTDPPKDTLVYKWSEHGDEIKNASKLLVGPGQACVFVYQGAIQAVHTESGIYDLKTDNIPFITTLKKVMQRFESEHKTHIFFFKTSQITGIKWGLGEAVKYFDAENEIPIGLKMFGNFSFQLHDPQLMMKNLFGVVSGVTSQSMKELFSSRMTSTLADILGEKSYPYSKLDANRNEICKTILDQFKEGFLDFGFKITDFRIDGTAFDDDTTAFIKEIVQWTGKAKSRAKAGMTVKEELAMDVLKTAAGNESQAGGAMGIGVGLGTGVGIGQIMGQMVGNAVAPQAGAAPAAPAAAAGAAGSPEERLAKLQGLLAKGLISQEDFEKKKAQILGDL